MPALPQRPHSSAVLVTRVVVGEEKVILPVSSSSSSSSNTKVGVLKEYHFNDMHACHAMHTALSTSINHQPNTLGSFHLRTVPSFDADKIE